jgi:hypothetical protein
LKRPVQRIVSGHDEHGQAFITEDQIVPSVHTNPKRVGYLEFGPQGDWLDKIDVSGTKEAWHALGTDIASTNKTGKAKHPFMHRTESLGYGLVLEGEITLGRTDLASPTAFCLFLLMAPSTPTFPNTLKALKSC